MSLAEDAKEIAQRQFIKAGHVKCTEGGAEKRYEILCGILELLPILIDSVERLREDIQEVSK